MTRTDPLATRTDPVAISIDFKDTVNVYVCVYSETAQTQVVEDYPVSRLLFTMHVCMSFIFVHHSDIISALYLCIYKTGTIQLSVRMLCVSE